MKVKIIILIIFLIPLAGLMILGRPNSTKEVAKFEIKQSYWFILHRKSEKEFLYFGNAGEIKNSKLVRVFNVKTGVEGKSPTPLPNLVGKKYWLINNKESSADNPDTSPYFLRLDVPTGSEWPYGPTPYLECNGQCDWVLPGYFGLHGVGEDDSKLSKDNPGSSGCIRHKNSDITYLYNLLDPAKEEIRYYIEDN